MLIKFTGNCCEHILFCYTLHRDWHLENRFELFSTCHFAYRFRRNVHVAQVQVIISLNLYKHYIRNKFTSINNIHRNITLRHIAAFEHLENLIKMDLSCFQTMKLLYKKNKKKSIYEMDESHLIINE